MQMLTILIENWYQLIAAFLGILGFSLFFRVHPRHLVVTVPGGVFAWVIYLLAQQYYNDAFVSNMLAAMFAATWAELFARIKKAPTNVFLIPAIFPLLPGESFYYTMTALVNDQRAYFVSRAMQTLRAVFGIACGILAVSMFAILLRRMRFHEEHG